MGNKRWGTQVLLSCPPLRKSLSTEAKNSGKLNHQFHLRSSGVKHLIKNTKKSGRGVSSYPRTVGATNANLSAEEGTTSCWRGEVKHKQPPPASASTPLPPQAQPGTQTTATTPHCGWPLPPSIPHSSRSPGNILLRFQGKLSGSSHVKAVQCHQVKPMGQRG